MTSLLVATDLSKAFKGRHILRAAELECQAGERLCLLGRSGTGKTTLLRILAGLERPDSGQVLVGGRHLHEYSRHNWPISLAFQKPAVYPHLTVGENIAFPLKARGWARTQIASRIKHISQLVQVDTLMHQKGRNLSGGEAQRVALAKCIAASPKLLLLDEPVSSVDSNGKWELLRVLRRIHEAENTTMLLVTHEPSVARFFADAICVLTDGQCGPRVSPTVPLHNIDNINTLRALSQPPPNELELNRAGENGDSTLYSSSHSLLSIATSRRLSSQSLLLAFMPGDCTVASSTECDAAAAFTPIMQVISASPAGWSADGGPQYDVATELSMSVLASGPIDLADPLTLCVNTERVMVFDNTDGRRVSEFTFTPTSQVAS